MAVDMDKPLTGRPKAPKPACSASVKSTMPILEWLPNYPWKECLTADISGGLTLGCILMGQSLAHADLCKVHLINGPYSCMMPPIMYAIFGTSIHASVGTGALVALLTGEQLIKLGDDIDYRTHAAAIMTLEVGVILFVMGVCRLAFLARFLSRPALSGFITGSSVLIICSQLVGMIGLPPWAAKGGFFGILRHHRENFSHFNAVTTLMSVAGFAFLSNAKRLGKFRGLKAVNDFKELIAMAVCLCVAQDYNATVEDEARKIIVVGHMPTGLPSFSLPVHRDDCELARELFPGAALVAIVVFLCSFAGAKKFAMKDGYQIRPFNELIALGMANFVGSFNGSVPTQIGLSRMSIAHMCGVQSQFGANILVGATVAAITQVLSVYLYSIPKCILCCIIVNGARHLSEFSEFAKLLRMARDSQYTLKSRCEFFVWLVGFGATLYFGAFLGMVIAVVFSLFLILHQVVHPEITELGVCADSVDEKLRPGGRSSHDRKWVNIARESAAPEDGILVFRLEGPLFYANVESLQEWVDEHEVAHEEQTGQPYKGIILSAAAIPFIDISATETLKEMITHYSKRNILFLCANTFGQVGRIITNNLEKKMSTMLRSEELRQVLHRCSSVDDFVQLIKEHHEPQRVGLRRSGISKRYTTPKEETWAQGYWMADDPGA